jgi:hypothetical protein
MESQEIDEFVPVKKTRPKKEDKIFRNEGDIVVKTAQESSDSEYEAMQIDDLEGDELGFMLDDKTAARGKNVGKKNATDRSGETNAQDLEEREDEADDTVFIDNLPKDEGSLR